MIVGEKGERGKGKMKNEKKGEGRSPTVGHIDLTDLTTAEDLTTPNDPMVIQSW